MTKPLVQKEASGAPPLVVPRLPGEVRLERLANGLQICLLHNPQAPVVTSALWIQAGTRDEGPAEGGIAHFLEHMMFKGSGAYGPGEIDRRTQALGGSNNAFTSYDATAYYFKFSKSCWQESLAIEADRLVSLALDEGEVERERQVILEEISMYEDEPWDALELAVQGGLFPDHPYGRPVLGTRQSLLACGRDELASFYRRFYAPNHCVWVAAGDLPKNALARVEATLGQVPPSAAQRPALSAPRPVDEWRRLERRAGEVPRLLLALQAPGAAHPDHAVLRLLVTLLSSGRASRLQRRLVDEDQLCLWASGSLSESPVASQLSFAFELVPGSDPQHVEALAFEELRRLGTEPPAPAELARAKRVLVADWVFGHERVHQQALAAGFALSHFDLEHHHRSLAAAVALKAEDVSRVAARSFAADGPGGIIGWSLPLKRSR